ncbi:MAG: cytochrome b/b6 domain-containing protein, partial [Tabrizicola sp.]
MGLRNGPEEFGLVTRLIHWAMMLLIFGQLALGLRLDSMEPGLATLWLYGLHKTIGFAALAL